MVCAVPFTVAPGLDLMSLAGPVGRILRETWELQGSGVSSEGLIGLVIFPSEADCAERNQMSPQKAELRVDLWPLNFLIGRLFCLGLKIVGAHHRCYCKHLPNITFFNDQKILMS